MSTYCKPCNKTFYSKQTKERHAEKFHKDAPQIEESESETEEDHSNPESEYNSEAESASEEELERSEDDRASQEECENEDTSEVESDISEDERGIEGENASDTAGEESDVSEDEKEHADCTNETDSENEVLKTALADVIEKANVKKIEIDQQAWKNCQELVLAAMDETE